MIVGMARYGISSQELICTYGKRYRKDAVCVILEVVEDIPLDTPGRVGLIRTRVQTALRKYFDFTIHRHPIILPFFLEV
jgi:hypothetical protein